MLGKQVKSHTAGSVSLQVLRGKKKDQKYYQDSPSNATFILKVTFDIRFLI